MGGSMIGVHQLQLCSASDEIGAYLGLASITLTAQKVKINFLKRRAANKETFAISN